jgi:hypothetical protein
VLSLIEIVLRDGLKQKKSVLGPSKDVWGVLEAFVCKCCCFGIESSSLERYSASVSEMMMMARAGPAKTFLGKARVYIRMAVMNVWLHSGLPRLINRRNTFRSTCGD